MQKRKEIDFVNIVLCVLVMLIHILSRSLGSLDKTSIQYLSVLIPSRLSSFVVQGFIFLSGMKYFMRNKSGNFKYVPFLISRTKTIILPYVLWNVIFYFALMPLGFFIFDFRKLMEYISLGNMISHFYFVVIIVQFYLLMPLWKWLFDYVNEKLLVILSLIIMIGFGQYLAIGYIYNDRVFLKYIFYWILGCVVGKNMDNFMVFVEKNNFKILVLWILIAIVDCLGLYMINMGIQVRGLENIHIVYCILAILLIFALGGKLKELVDKPIFAMINRQSYNIYLSHCLVLYYCDYVLNVLDIYSAKGILLFRFTACYGITFILWGIYDRIIVKIRR